MFNNLIAAFAITSFGLGAMPAKANTSHSYRVGFAGAVMHRATCSYINGETTKVQSARKVIGLLENNGIPLSYATNSETLEMSHALYEIKGC